jgi:hypothetical protein
MESYWETVSGDNLSQGDLLRACKVPRLPEIFPNQETTQIQLDQYDLIIATQTCEIEQQKVTVVTLCPVWTLDTFERANPKIRDKWNAVLKGRQEGLHMLSSYDDASDNRTAFVVDFHFIFSLPLVYLQQHAATLGSRPRLRSPWLEDYSQAFARYFMRVALPCRVPTF